MAKTLKPNDDYSFYVRREYSVSQAVYIAPGGSDMLEEITDKKGSVRCEGEGLWCNVYVVPSEVDACVKYYVEAIESGEPFLPDEFKQLDQTGSAWVSKTKELAEEAKRPGADLGDLMLEFWQGWHNHIVPLWRTFVIPEASNLVLGRLFEQFVAPDQRNEAVAFYSRPSKKGHLARIADYFKTETDFAKRTAFLQTDYPWIFTTDPFALETTPEQYQEYARGTVSNSEDLTSENKLLPDEVMPIVRTCQDILYIKDHRDEYRRTAFYLIQPLVRAIIGKYNLTREELWFIKPEEIGLLASAREMVLRNAKERQKFYLVESDGSQTIFLQGDEAAENLIGRKKSTDEFSELKGVIGSPGKVQGCVQVIYSSKDCQNFKSGNILVATTTNPDYIAAMQRALAFVTDEGGITCHAAIVARELRKPCIVGTKVATQVLKDGDIVEVDADSGVVKIIENA